MQVILLEKMSKLGGLGDVVNVAPGYGRNFLIPQRKAVPATKANLADFAVRRAELEKTQAGVLAQAQARADALKDAAVTIGRQAGDDGRLFGSVGTQDIAAALTEAGHPVVRAEVRLPTGALKLTGEHAVDVQLHADVIATVTVNIVPSK